DGQEIREHAGQAYADVLLFGEELLDLRRIDRTFFVELEKRVSAIPRFQLFGFKITQRLFGRAELLSRGRSGCEKLDLLDLERFEFFALRFLILFEVARFLNETIERLGRANGLALQSVKAFGQTLRICVELSCDLVEPFERCGVFDELRPVRLELFFDLAHVIELQRILAFGFLQDQTRRVRFCAFSLVLFMQPLAFRFDELEPLLDRVDLTSDGIRATVQTDDLLSLIAMFPFGAVSFERVVGVAPPNLGQSLFDKARTLCRLSERLFLRSDLLGESVLNLDGFSELLLEAFDR